MNSPWWLLSIGLLFWGWQTGMWLWSIPMAAAVAAARWVQARWEFADADLNRICDLCWMFFVGAGIMLYSTEDRLIFIFRFVQWLPLVFFPIILAQIYGNRDAMPLSVFSWLLRRAPNNPFARKTFNISYPYFAICVMGASASTRPNFLFYAGVSIVILLGLMAARPRRSPLAVWIVLGALAVGAGFFSQQELRRMQNAMEGALGGWLADFFRPPNDSRERRTLIGSSHPIILSGRIVMRMHVAPGEITPALLREASFDIYKSETWLASSNDIGSLCASGTNDVIKLMTPKRASSEVEIARYYDDGEGPLALPQGTFEIDDLPAAVRTNRLGVTSMELGPDFADFHAHYGSGASLDSPPGPLDRQVPDSETNALRKIIKRFGIDKLPNAALKIRAVEAFFRDNHFTYSLNAAGRRRKPQMGRSWLAWFLEESHAGHCEYFATATVLLLREAGIPARYATGYAVPETVRQGQTYLIRERHAHAWALAYRPDTKLWEQIDTTPGGWAEAADARPPWWESTTDFLSNLFFQFSKWRWSKTSFARYTEWLMAPLILYLIWRILTTERQQRQVKSEDASGQSWPGLDSELYLINQRLISLHLDRFPNEPLRDWEERLHHAFPGSGPLRRIFQLHRRLRFDPLGLHETDRVLLRDESRAWLAQMDSRIGVEK